MRASHRHNSSPALQHAEAAPMSARLQKPHQSEGSLNSTQVEPGRSASTPRSGSHAAAASAATAAMKWPAAVATTAAPGAACSTATPVGNASQYRQPLNSQLRLASPGRHSSPSSSGTRSSSFTACRSNALSGAALAAGSALLTSGSSSARPRPPSPGAAGAGAGVAALSRHNNGLTGGLRRISSGSSATQMLGTHSTPASAHQKSNSWGHSAPGGFRACLQPRVKGEDDPPAAAVLPAAAAARGSRPGSPVHCGAVSSYGDSKTSSIGIAGINRPAINCSSSASMQPPRLLAQQQAQPGLLTQQHQQHALTTATGASRHCSSSGGSSSSRRQFAAIGSPSDESYLQRLQQQRHSAAAAAAASLGNSGNSSSSAVWASASSRTQLALQRLMSSSQRTRSVSAGLADLGGLGGKAGMVQGVTRSFSDGPSSARHHAHGPPAAAAAAAAGGAAGLSRLQQRGNIMATAAPAAGGSESAAGSPRELLGRQQQLLQGGLLEAAAWPDSSPLCAANPLAQLRQQQLLCQQQQQPQHQVTGQAGPEPHAAASAVSEKAAAAAAGPVSCTRAGTRAFATDAHRQQQQHIMHQQQQPQQQLGAGLDAQQVARHSSSGGGSTCYLSAGGSSIRSTPFISLSGSDAEGPPAAAWDDAGPDCPDDIIYGICGRHHCAGGGAGVGGSTGGSSSRPDNSWAAAAGALAEPGRGSRLASASRGASSWQTQPQEQQEQRRTSGSSSGSSSTVSSRAPSFLIATCALVDDAADVADDVSGSGSGSAPASPAAAVALGMCQADPAVLVTAEESRDDATAALQFLTASFSSRSSSFTGPAGAGAGTGAPAGAGAGVAAAAAAVSARAALLQLHQRQQEQQWQQEQGKQSRAPAVSTAGEQGSCSSSSGDDESDVSELSTSLQQCESSSDDDSSSCSSSQSGSSPRGCNLGGSGRGAAARLWLAGRRRGLGGSSSSIASEGCRSSSCDSRRDAEPPCGSSGSSGSGSSGSTAVPLTAGAGGAASGSSRLGVSGGVVRRAPAAAGSYLPPGCVGLTNLGNTCYMNSILQCLNCLPEFVAALGPMQQQQWFSRVWNSKASVGPALSELLQQMWAAQASPPPSLSSSSSAAATAAAAVVSPRRLVRALSAADERWGCGCQQDSQEFLHSLLELLQDESNRVSRQPQYRELSCQGSEVAQAAEAAAYARTWHNSLVDDLFGGQLQSTVTCGGCGARSHRFDPMLDLCVPLPKGAPLGKAVSLQECLSAFTEEEVLSGSEAVTCSACKATCTARKRLQVFTPPLLLVLTLKRFNSSSSSGLLGGWALGGFSPYSKNTTPVRLDAEGLLDLTAFCNPLGLAAAAAQALPVARPMYRLAAVSEHSGCMAGGHYTAQGRAVADRGWYAFNDAAVAAQRCPVAGSSSSAAYVLFFRLSRGT